MSAAFALALLMQAGSAAPVAAPETDIVVLGEKLKYWRGLWRSRDGVKAECVTKRSTGDKEIDAIGCDALVRCSEPRISDFLALKQSKNLPRAERKRREAAIHQSVGQCLVRERDAGITALSDLRAAQKAGVDQ